MGRSVLFPRGFLQIAADEKLDPAELPPASLVVVAQEDASLQQGLALCGGDEGPVIPGL
jgi:hypothetical protein